MPPVCCCCCFHSWIDIDIFLVFIKCLNLPVSLTEQLKPRQLKLNAAAYTLSLFLAGLAVCWPRVSDLQCSVSRPNSTVCLLCCTSLHKYPAPESSSLKMGNAVTLCKVQKEVPWWKKKKISFSFCSLAMLFLRDNWRQRGGAFLVGCLFSSISKDLTLSS